MPQSGQLYIVALSNAMEVIGGAGKLAQRLGVSEAVVWRWLRGQESIPESAFLIVVDILMQVGIEKLERRGVAGSPTKDVS